MKIKLLEMRLQNFAGIEELIIVTNGNDMNIFGANGAGKTTIANAWYWLLFGKNTAGKTEFAVKPLNIYGDEIHHLETSVEAMLDCDGEKVSLKKVLKESWVRKRGSIEPTYAGNETEYYFNTQAVKKNEYQKEIEKIIPETVFKVVTDPLYFNEKMDWKSRRALLMEVAGGITDNEVYQKDPSLIPLSGADSDKEKLRDSLNKKLKEIDNELNKIPIQIAEVERNVPAPADVKAIEAELAQATKKEEAALAMANSLKSGEMLIDLKNKLKEKEAELDSLKLPAQVDMPSYEDSKKIGNTISELLAQQKNNAFDLDIAKRRISATYEELNALEDNIKKLYSDIFTNDICPTCKRLLPEDEVEKRKADFNLAKATTIEELSNKKSELERDLGELTERLYGLEGEEARLKKSLEDAYEKKIVVIDCIKIEFEDAMKEYNTKQEALTKEISEIKESILAYDETIAPKIAGLKEEYLSARSRKEESAKVLAGIRFGEEQKKRVEELKAKQKELAEEYSGFAATLAMAERFIITKAEMLSEKVNGLFKKAEFKLFDTQINGNIIECCEVAYKGVAYRDLNNAAKLNIGLDVLNYVCQYHNCYAPIFLDNAEGVTEIEKTESQQIRLYVSPISGLHFEIMEG